MSKVAFGGERLGTGGKFHVELKEYERSTHDLGFTFRSSMAPGTLVPFLVEPTMPGDTFDIKLNADVKTHPTLGPLFGSFKLQLDIFWAPLRLYMSGLMQNTKNVGLNMSQFLLPMITSDTIPIQATQTDAQDNIHINSSALLSYLGIRGWGRAISGTPQRQMLAVPLLEYWEIYGNYYANKQEQNGYYLQPQTAGPQNITTITAVNPSTTIPQNQAYPNGTPTTLTANSNLSIAWTTAGPNLNQVMFSTPTGWVSAQQLGGWSTAASPYVLQTGTYGQYYGLQIYGWEYATTNALIAVTTFPLTNIDTMKTGVFQVNPTTRLVVNSSSNAPYGPSVALANTPNSQCGLALKTYQSDLLNNWMYTGWYNTIQTTSAIAASGFINVDAIILGRKVYDLLNRIAVSGNTYSDYIKATYDTHGLTDCISPIYCGGLSKEIIFQQVVSTAGTNSQPLATLAGQGHMGAKHKGGDIRVKSNEWGFIMGIASITPRLDYSQGNDWFNYALNTIDSFHKPALDQIGWQNLITEQMAWWDTTLTGAGIVAPTQNSAGMQPAWLNYTTRINKCLGNFAIQNNEMFMTLNRRYQVNVATGGIQDLTTYIDPTHYNFIFAQTNLDAQNFWVQIAIDNIARRKMSHHLIPNL